MKTSNEGSYKIVLALSCLSQSLSSLFTTRHSRAILVALAETLMAVSRYDTSYNLTQQGVQFVNGVS